MTNEIQNPNNTQRKYDLEERTANFGEGIIEFAKSLSKDAVNLSLIKQLVRAGTSIGANYMEADGADTKKDFRYKISICRKEAKETCHWLRMVAKANPDKKERARELWKESQELVYIFSSILKR